MEKTKRKILDMVSQGQITADEGLRLMNAMNKGAEGAPAQSEQVGESGTFEPEYPPEGRTSAIPAEDLNRMKQLKRWWLLPFGIGLVILLLGATWMYMGYSNAGFGFGFWLAWLPFLLGIAILAVSFNSRKGVWLHLNVKQAPGESPQNIRISLPMPLNLARWFFSTFGDKVTGLKDQPIGDIPSILENLSPEEPFYLHVNDNEDGEEVEIFIG